MSHHEYVQDAPERASRFVAFIDECGDHSWTHINPEFPLFVLSTIIVERDLYVRKIVPAFANLKLRYWPRRTVRTAPTPAPSRWSAPSSESCTSLMATGETSRPVIAEARGKNEDAALSASFYKLLHDGTRNTPAERFRRLRCPMTFVRKVQNIAGTQLAEPCGYPASRNILKPAQPNLAFDVVRAHLYARDGESGWQVLP